MKRHTAIGSLTFELQLTGNCIQLFPAGEFRAEDGRPHDVPCWLLTAEIAKNVIARLAKRKNKIVIDYEHQTLLAEQNGQPAPAAGWWRGSNAVWRDTGLFVENVEWTDDAQSMIAKKEYLYISPVFQYDPKTGEVYDVLNAALTNNPALDGMNEVALAAASRLANLNHNNSLENDMSKEMLALMLKLLGLQEGASEADVLAALQQAVGQMPVEGEASASLSKLLTLFKGQTTEITALKTAAIAAAQKPGNPDPSQYVPIDVVTALRNDLVALSSRVNGNELDGLIDDALKSGKLLPSMKDWATDLGKKDMAALRSYIDASAPIAALTSQQNGGNPPVDTVNGLSAIELEAAKLTGLTPAEYAAAKKELK